MAEQNTTDDIKRLCLGNLGGKNAKGQSGADEVFQEHLREVLDNIARVDTEATAKREITLKIAFLPNVDRTAMAVEVAATCKLAPLNSAHGRALLGLHWGEQVAAVVEETLPLFDEKKADVKIVGAQTAPAPAPAATGTSGK